MNETVTYRAHIVSLDSAGAAFKWSSGVHEHVTVHMDPDRFKAMGRPGWIEVAISPIAGTA